METFQTIQQGKNQVGTAFKVMVRRGDKFSVWKLCGNYDGKVRGGIAYVWRYKVLDVGRDEAMATYAKLTAGRAK
jgi:hypothetical protein